MVMILLLQQCYNLPDPEIEREIRDRISFMNFLGYPEKLPHVNAGQDLCKIAGVKLIHPI
jgi:transposase, IS4 family